MAKTEATQATVQVATPKQRGGVLGRLFRRSPRGTSPKASLSPTIVNKQDKRDRTPSPKNGADDETPRDVPEMHPEVTPVVAPKQQPPKQEPPKQEPPQENKTQDAETPVPDDHPVAVESAFFGPPRYRWMDIETSAAVRVQSAYRRNKVMNDLERQGITTSAIRNRNRRRQYTKQHKQDQLSKLFTCCGAEFVLDGFTQDDYEVQEELNKTAYEEKKKAMLDHEEQLRNNFGKIARKKKRNRGKVAESFEVVE